MNGLSDGSSDKPARLDRLLDHGGGRVALHHGLARVACVIIIAHGAEELLQIETLVLKRVREFVRKDHLLHLRDDPVGDKHRL